MTYVMAYGGGVPSDPTVLETLREAPPNLLHIGHGVPLNSIFGPAADYSGFNPELIPVAAILDRRKELRAFVDAVHQAGVERVICYINPSILGGDHQTRQGFWAFYDHWRDYSRLGIGPKPERPPEQWMQRDRRSFAPWEPEPDYSMWRYQPCINEPAWARYQTAVVRLIVESGYDGVFVDDCIMECRHDLCQQRFAEHLRERYTPEQRHQCWADDLRLAGTQEQQVTSPGERLRRAETFLFWQHSVASFLGEIRRTSQQSNPDFLTVPNWGAISRVGGAAARARSGKSVAVWRDACDYQMFEEDHPAGFFGEGDVFGHLPQYLHALALGVRPVILTYATSPRQFELGYAECAAGGGGAFVQAGLAFPEIRRKWRTYYTAHRDLYEAYRLVAPVGLVVSFDELRLGNDAHLLASYALMRTLMGRHVPFAIVPGERLATHPLHDHQVVVVPDVRCLPSQAIAALRDYVSRGGSLLTLGNCGTLDSLGKPRAAGSLADLGILSASTEPHASHNGAGRIAHATALSELVPARDIALIRALDTREAATFHARLRRLPPLPDAHPETDRLYRWLCALAERPLTIVGTSDRRDTRTVIYQRFQDDRGSLCAHAVRYSVALDTSKAPSTPSTPLELQLPLPDGWTVSRATVHGPARSSAIIPVDVANGIARCRLPAFEFYALLNAELQRTSPAKAETP